MAASVKIEFDDGSRVISQTLEEAAGAGVMDARIGSSALSADKRPSSCSIDDFYEIPKTVAFIADGKFRRVALQFPDGLLREAPEVLWTLQARVRKLAAGADSGGGGSAEEGTTAETAAAAVPPLIFVTGDTSYGSCCVDEVSAQHLKADAIVHYGRACLTPTSSSVPVLYVFGRGSLDLDDLASALLAGPLSAAPPDAAAGATADDIESSSPPPLSTRAGAGTAGGSGSSKPPVLLLYDVTYAYAIPALLERLAEVSRDGRLVVGFPTPEAYSPLGASSASASRGGRCGSGATSTSTSALAPTSSTPTSALSEEQKQQQIAANGGSGSDTRPCCRGSDDLGGAQGTGGGCADGDKACCGGGGAATGRLQGGDIPQEEAAAGTEGARTACAASAGCSRRAQEQSATAATASPPPPATASASAPAAPAPAGVNTLPVPKDEDAGRPPPPPPPPSEKRRIRIGGLGVELESEEELQRHALVFVGGEGRQLSNVLMRCAGCIDRVRYDPALPPGQRLVGDTRKGNKDLMRRYYLVQRAREAGVIGIVVGTLGVQRYGSVVRSLRRMVEDAGRKAYTLAVGKVNVAKLANFAEVEVFCLVACAENSLLDSREFHAPVVTPLELEVALGKREWGGFYSTDFDDLLGMGAPQDAPKPPPPPGPDDTDPTVEPLTLADPAAAGGRRSPKAAGEIDGETGDGGGEEGNDDEDDQPFFSLVTGTYQNKPGVSRRPGGGHSGGSDNAIGGAGAGTGTSEGAIVGVGDRSLVEWSSPAADFLAKREFQGLEALVGQTEAKAATEGQSGIASDYGGV